MYTMKPLLLDFELLPDFLHIPRPRDLIFEFLLHVLVTQFQSTNLRFGELDNISLVQSGPAKIHLRGHFEQNHEIIENFSSFEDIEESDEFDGDNLFDYFLGSSEGVDVYGSNLDQWEEYSSIGESSGPVIEELPTEDESDEPTVENEASKTRQKRHKKKAKHSKTK